MSDQTVVLIKPDGVRKGIIGEILARFERVGLKVVSAKLIWVNKTHIGKHYRDDQNYHRGVGERTLENYKKYGLDPKEKLGTKDPVEIGKLVRNWNMKFLTSGPVFALLLEGPGAIEIVRKMTGFTYPAESAPGTIRGDYSYDSAYLANTQGRTIENLIHASGSKEEAEFEKKLWFKRGEIYSY